MRVEVNLAYGGLVGSLLTAIVCQEVEQVADVLLHRTLVLFVEGEVDLINRIPLEITLHLFRLGENFILHLDVCPRRLVVIQHHVASLAFVAPEVQGALDLAVAWP
jgi:hypothetical protein